MPPAEGGDIEGDEREDSDKEGDEGTVHGDRSRPVAAPTRVRRDRSILKQGACADASLVPSSDF